MSATAAAQHGAIAFAERLLSLLDQGRFTATYKYAVLLGLIDVCLESTSGEGKPPSRIPTADLARKVLELYWPHTVAFAANSGKKRSRADALVLRQNVRGQAEIVTMIERFRDRTLGDRRVPLSQARAAKPEAFDRLLTQLEWKLAEMPLPRLQLVGNTEVAFVYSIGWDRSVTRRQFFSEQSDRSVHLKRGVGEHLVALAGLLRPLIQRQWTAWIAHQTQNRELVEDAYLDEFLFGTERIALEKVREPLRELQRGRCFYCQRAARKDAQVDHFIPWSRYFDNGIENLVLACQPCNNAKLNYLAAGEHLSRWTERTSVRSESAVVLEELADSLTWESHPRRTSSVARSLYLRLPAEALLWLDRDKSVPVKSDRARIRSALKTLPA